MFCVLTKYIVVFFFDKIITSACEYCLWNFFLLLTSQVALFVILFPGSLRWRMVNKQLKKTGSDGRITCPKNCGSHYKSKSGLYNHLKYECGVDPQFKCNFCGKTFARHSNMRRHMLVHLPGSVKKEDEDNICNPLWFYNTDS